MAPPSPQLLRWTRFASNPHGTGPEKRTAQITELITSAGFAINEMSPPEAFPRPRVWLAGLKAWLHFGRHASVDRAGPGLLGYRSLFYAGALARHPGARVLVWETTYDTLLPYMARAAGYRIVAVPHNLESLVTEAVFASSAYDLTDDLGAEMRRLRLADAVYTIAREERWFLETYGIAAHYLPYYPDSALAQECAEIRSARLTRTDQEGRISGPLLLLGSAINPASARGMERQLNWLTSQQGLPAPDVVVAGSATDTLFSKYASSRVRLLGKVSREVLTDLLRTCSAMLIHTFGGAGAVTRIPEALLAGVPVIANPNAARDQQNTAGVHVYDSPEEFHQLLRHPLPMPPAPPRPAAAATRFQEEIARQVHQASS